MTRVMYAQTEPIAPVTTGAVRWHFIDYARRTGSERQRSTTSAPPRGSKQNSNLEEVFSSTLAYSARAPESIAAMAAIHITEVHDLQVSIPLIRHPHAAAFIERNTRSWRFP